MKPHDVQSQSCFVSAVPTAAQVIVKPVSDQSVSDAPAAPRPAATILLLRRGGRHAQRGLELLMVERGPGQTGMPGVWVFPRGVVEDCESADECAARELREEAGIDLGPEPDLRPWMRWITPEAVPVRFDTHFFVALAPAHSPPRADGAEVSDAIWISPREALARHEAGRMKLVFPTIRTLETLLPYETATAVLDAARDRVVEPILPRVVGTPEDHRILLPGDEGYEVEAAGR